MDALREVTTDNVDELGFFCCMSKRDSEGWQAKRAWLDDRFPEGLKLYLLPEGERGFVEFAPGDVAWKPVEAAGWTVIHCLWVVGRSGGKGGGARLLERCIDDARAARSHGVAVIATEDNFATSSKFYAHHGFVVVDEAPPRFRLMALAFGDADPPRFVDAVRTTDAPESDGLRVQTTDQCPYHAQLGTSLARAAGGQGLDCAVVKLTSAAQIRSEACTAQGTFGVSCKGEALPNVYMPKSLEKALARRS
jgi:GNAT superfamily N-acetyltransferase